MSEQVEKLLEVWNSHDGGKVAELYAEDASCELVGLPPVLIGREAVGGMVVALDRFSNDYRLTSASVQESGGWFAIETEMAGTHTGEMFDGTAATNKPYRYRMAWVGRLDADGKVTEHRTYGNVLDIYTELGLPAPGPLTAPGA